MEVRGRVGGWEVFFMFWVLGVWWEASVWPERSASGLEHERVSVCVFLFSFFLKGRARWWWWVSLSNSKERWNLVESVGLCPPIIQVVQIPQLAKQKTWRPRI